MAGSKLDLYFAQQSCQNALAALHEKHFEKSMKMTIVARDPSNDECHIICTDDDLEKLGEFLIQQGKKEATARKPNGL